MTKVRLGAVPSVAVKMPQPVGKAVQPVPLLVVFRSSW